MQISLFSVVGVATFAGGKTASVWIKVLSVETGIIAKEELIFFSKDNKIFLASWKTGTILVKKFATSARIVAKSKLVVGIFSPDKETGFACG